MQNMQTKNANEYAEKYAEYFTLQNMSIKMQNMYNMQTNMHKNM
jgi:hypothetical protein